MFYEISFIVFFSLVFGLFAHSTAFKTDKNRHLGSLVTFIVVYLTIKALNIGLDLIDVYHVIAVMFGYSLAFFVLKIHR